MTRALSMDIRQPAGHGGGGRDDPSFCGAAVRCGASSTDTG
ncbi:MAG: hypothetical protein RJQ21_19595 [Rhodospirillales bacterium]